MNEKLLSIEGLRIHDESGNALVNGVSLEIYDNEFVGIVGESDPGNRTHRHFNWLPPDYLFNMMIFSCLYTSIH